MDKILKYRINPGMNKLMLPRNAIPFSGGEQFRSKGDGFEYPRTQQLVMWVMGDLTKGVEGRDFLVINTGQDIPFDQIDPLFTINTRLQCHFHVLEVWPKIEDKYEKAQKIVNDGKVPETDT